MNPISHLRPVPVEVSEEEVRAVLALFTVGAGASQAEHVEGVGFLAAHGTMAAGKGVEQVGEGEFVVGVDADSHTEGIGCLSINWTSKISM